MARVMNIVFGIGIAVLLFIVTLLGISVFYPRPDADDFGCRDLWVEKPHALCTDNMTVGDCNELQKTLTIEKENSEYQKCWDNFSEIRDEYNKNYFITTSILGFIAIVVSMYLFNMSNIAAGTAFSGLALIVFGFMIGWESANDLIKFIVSLIITTVVIVFAVKVNRRYQNA